MAPTTKAAPEIKWGRTWKVLVAIAVLGFLFVCIPLSLSHYGIVWQLKDKAVLVLSLAAFTLIVKVVVSDLAGGEFTYHKQGHDFCLLTLGTSLSTLSLQLTALNTPYLKDLPTSGFPFGIALDLAGRSAVGQQILILLSVLLSSLLGTLLTALIARDIKTGNPRWSALLSGISFTVGISMFIFYVLLLIVKG